MNSIEEYQNLVGLLQEALKFYANENNYMKGKLPEGEFDFNVCIRPECRIPIPSLIDKDGGFQARFALERAKQLAELNQKMQDDYDNAVSSGLHNWENTANWENIEKEIKENRIINNDKNL
jgi:hypothetical protein